MNTKSGLVAANRCTNKYFHGEASFRGLGFRRVERGYTLPFLCRNSGITSVSDIEWVRGVQWYE